MQKIPIGRYLKELTMPIGPTELILILVLVTIFFGVGRLPEVFSSIGKGVREFRKATDLEAAAKDEEEETVEEQTEEKSR
jgi:sec-independent protein translocase protein TatA